MLIRAMAQKTRRYSIRIFDIEADHDVIFTAVDWTDEEKRLAERLPSADRRWRAQGH
jgi:hypothetical protein